MAGKGKKPFFLFGKKGEEDKEDKGNPFAKKKKKVAKKKKKVKK